MARLIRVRSLCGDRVAAYEQHPDHPGGQAMITEPGKVYQVAPTPFILGRVGMGMLEIVEEEIFTAEHAEGEMGEDKEEGKTIRPRGGARRR